MSSQSGKDEVQRAGSGGLSGAKIGDRVGEGVDEIMPPKPHGREEAELSVSRSGGVGDPIYGDPREYTAWDPGKDKWWKPYVDDEGDTEIPKTLSDIQVGVLLIEATDEVRNFVKGVIRCKDPKLPNEMQKDKMAMRVYYELVMECRDEIDHPLPKIMSELRQEAMHNPDLVARRQAIIDIYLYPHYKAFHEKRAHPKHG